MPRQDQSQTGQPPDLFRPDEREALRPPEDLKPSEWAERYRVLPIGVSNIPGPWRNDNAPYLRGLMDLAVAPGVIQLNIQKAGQIGVSEAARNLILYWAATDPDPMGLALPDKIKGRKIVREQVIPAIEGTLYVAALLTTRKWDLSGEKIRLANGFLLHLMWAGSASSTSADPMRRVINDEVDKFAEWAGRETNPIGRTWTRTRSYGDRRFQMNISTPTDRFGNICRLWEASGVQLEFMCPCSHCGEFQYLSFRQLRWPAPDGPMTRREKLHMADRILANNDVWYLCLRCDARIEPPERVSMVRAGRWRSPDGSIEDAEAVGEWPRGTRIGAQIGAMACLWQPWAGIAAEFIRAEGDRDLTFSFRTETLGEPWEQQVEKPRASVYADKSARATLPEGVVPAWAVKLLATVDTQHDHFYVVVRAWGPDMRSQRVFHARAETFAELDDICFRHVWRIERPAGATGQKGGAKPELILIDSGGTRLEGETASRTIEVYRWVQSRGGLVRAIKGASSARQRHEGLYVWPGRGFLDEGGSRGGKRERATRRGLTIWYLDTHHFGDILAELVARGAEEGAPAGAAGDELWLLNQANDEDYNTQLSNVQKRVVRTGHGPAEERWEPSETGAANHYWDCEVYQIAAAYMANVHLLPSAEDLAEYRKAAAMEQRTRAEALARRRGKQTEGWDVGSLEGYL